MEHAEHAEHAAHSNRKVALLIAVLALFLSFSETLGKSAQTEAIGANVESANLWSFFQAKTIRMTTVRTAAEEMKLSARSRHRSGRQGGDREADRGLAKDRRALRFRAGDEGRPQGARRTRQGGRRRARSLPGEISSLRNRVGGVSDRHRAVLGGGDHRASIALAWLPAPRRGGLPCWRSAYSRRMCLHSLTHVPSPGGRAPARCCRFDQSDGTDSRRPAPAVT